MLAACCFPTMHATEERAPESLPAIAEPAPAARNHHGSVAGRDWRRLGKLISSGNRELALRQRAQDPAAPCFAQLRRAARTRGARGVRAIRAQPAFDQRLARRRRERKRRRDRDDHAGCAAVRRSRLVFEIERLAPNAHVEVVDGEKHDAEWADHGVGQATG